MTLVPYYADDSVTIYHGDCRDVLPALSYDVAVMDPPYGIGLDAKRAKRRNGTVSVRAGSYTFDDSPAYIRDVVVPIVELCRTVAKAVVVTPGTRNLWAYPSSDDVGCFYSAGGTGLGKWGFTCSQPILYYGSDPYLRTSRGARANSFGQTYPNDANDYDHPCAKPIRQWRWLINRVSLPGEIVCDPFMGSGTTLEAAKYLNRRVIGIEIEERYCEIAARRCAQEVLDLRGAA